MKTVASVSVVLCLMLVTAPACATVVIDAGQAAETATTFGSAEAGWPVVTEAPAAAKSSPVDVISNTLISYASLLPAPSDWVLLVTGFGVIGYAMRSRKRGRVSFN